MLKNRLGPHTEFLPAVSYRIEKENVVDCDFLVRDGFDDFLRDDSAEDRANRRQLAEQELVQVVQFYVRKLVEIDHVRRDGF